MTLNREFRKQLSGTRRIYKDGEAYCFFHDQYGEGRSGTSNQQFV